ncbi:hypothetical protein ACFVH4_18280 [Nocardia ignorata]|uniref:hypothetical protein n=1 Tax=Nocardia ignorata TaxID=145285 RepID=UPI0036257050
MLAQTVGEVVGVLLGIDAEIGGIRVGGEIDVDQELVAAEERLRVVEGGVYRSLGVFHLDLQLGRCHQVCVGDVGANGGDRDPAGADLEPANAVGGAG